MSAEGPLRSPTGSSARRAGLSNGTILGYGLGNFAFALLGLVVAVNLQFFYTDYVGLSAGLVAWSLLFARMFDAVTDPVMGWLSDHTNTAIGRRRPWILAACIPLAFAFYFLFTPPEVSDPEAQQGFLLAYMLALYILTYFIWTVGAVPYYSLGAELTDDYIERVKVISVREACSLAGLLVATILPAYLIYQYGGRDGYSFMGGILGALAAGFLVLSALVSSERAEFRGRPGINPYAGWIATFDNPHFRKLLVAFFFSAVAAAVPAVLVIYVSVYIIGTPAWWANSIPGWLPTWSYYLLIYFTAGTASLPLWNWVSRRIGKRNTWGIAIFLAAVTSAGCWWLSEGSIAYFSFLLVFGGMSFGNYLALPPAIVADVIDYDEVSTGRRREGSYFAIWAFVTKLGAAVTGFTALQVLEHVGYVPGVAQTQTVKIWMLWMYSWFPAGLYFVSLVTLFRFQFTADDVAHAQRQVGRG
jgi:GPH family glycoside/pentoside/hexuronide:cation symporter